MKIKKSTFTVVLLLFCSLLAGAIAVEAEATFTVDSTNDAVDANPGDGICATTEGECTLRAAIQETNALSGADRINIPVDTFTLTLSGLNEDAAVSGDLDISDDLSIYGGNDSPDEPWTTIQGGQLDRVFHILPGSIVEINYVVISHGDVQDPIGGGGIYNQGDLTLYTSKVIQNNTAGGGGGVRNEGSLFCDSCDILNNAANEGGGIYNSGLLNIFSSSINDNTSIGPGGGIYNTEEAIFSLHWAGVCTNMVTGTANGGGIYNLGHMELGEIALVSFNKTNGSGGGIYNAGTMQVFDLDSSNNFAGIDGGSIFNTGNAQIQSSFIYENTASSGAGIHSEWLYSDYPIPPTVTVHDSTIHDNHATLMAGGILSHIGTFNIENSTIEGNTANIAGGIATFSGIMDLSNTTVSNNSATSQGGGFFNVGDIHLLSSFVYGNTAQDGGGFYNNKSSVITLNETDLTGNSAQNGGGLYNLGFVGITDSILQNNSADFEGGGLYNLAGHAEIDRSSLYANSAQTGGGIWNASSEFQLEETASMMDLTNEHISELFYAALASQRDKAEQAALPDPPVPGVVIIWTSTIGANTATDQGGALYNLSEVQLLNDTFSDNIAEEGDSIFNGDASARVVILNTILASSDVDDNCAGLQNLESGGFNLETGDSCGLYSEGDLIETDPLLMFIDFPGIGLSPRSPAIDAGSNQLCGDTDQRGVTRPIDGTGDGIVTCDIGSYEAPEPDLIFADVPLNHWAYDYIISLYEDGYIAGCATDPERLFCPEDNMNRAESSVFIVRGLHPDIPGYMPPIPTVQYFDDVPIGADEKWFSKWVGELNEQGFTSGCNEDPPLFCPEKGHIRAEATVFYLRMAYGPDFYPLEPSHQIYNDVAPGQWYYRWVNAAHEAGLIQPCQTDMENMLFRPEEDLTRAEAACMMMMAKELPSNPRGNSVVEAAFTDAALLNPIVVYDQASSDVNSKLFLGLLNVDAFSGEIVGEIAESWEVSADGLTYTFNLREDILWTDGTPVTAKDAKFTYEAIEKEIVGSPLKYIVANVESIEVVNDHTLRMTFYLNDCSSLQDFTVGILPAHMYADDFSDIYDNQLNHQPTVTNGPFKFDEWVKADHITLIRNETYYLGAPDVDKWIRRIYADIPSATAAFLAGQVDIMDVEREDVATIEAEITNGEPFAIKPLLTDGYSFLAMNNGNPNNPEMGWVDENENESFDEGEPANIEQEKHPILSDKLVRQAIAYAIDIDDIIQQVALGQAAPLAANVTPAIGWAHNSTLEPYALDTEKASLLLDEAGWVREGNGIRMKDGEPLALSIMTNYDNMDREKMAAMIKDDLDALGFDITVEVVEWGAFVVNLLGQEFDMAVIGWIGLGSDPDDTEFWAYRYDEPGAGFNFTSYYNEEVESKLFEANSLVGCPLQDRAALYHDIQAQIHEDAPYAFLFTPMTNVAWNTRLQGINPGSWSTYYNVEEWSITP